MRRRILFAIAVPVGAVVARKLAEQLTKHGHDQAGSRIQKVADRFRPQKKE